MGVSQYVGVEPVTRAFLENLRTTPGRALSELPIEDARAEFARAEVAGAGLKPPADIEDRTIPVGPRGEVKIRIVRPKGEGGTLPVVMFFHGGGWVFGDRETHDRLIRKIAIGARAAVVFVDYTRPPEARYPIAVEEAYSATTWIADHGGRQGLDPSRLAVVGDSAGGNMAAAVTLLAKERRGPGIRLQVLFYPVTDANFNTPSYLQFKEGYLLTREGVKWSWNQYAPDETVRKAPTASPLQASIEELRGLPPALIITGELDVLRDEVEAYAHKLMDAGVPVTATRYLGTIHAFVNLGALAASPPARAAITQANAALFAAFWRDPTQTADWT